MSYQKKLRLLHYLTAVLTAALIAFAVRSVNRVEKLEHSVSVLSGDLTYIAGECRTLQSENARLREYIESMEGGES